MAGDAAVEGVLAGLEVGRDLRDGAVLDDLPLLVDAVALDRDVVVGRGLVLRVDLEVAGGRRRGGELVGQRARGVGRDRELAALSRGRLVGALDADGGERSGVLAALRRGAGHVGGDVARVLTREELGRHGRRRSCSGGPGHRRGAARRRDRSGRGDSGGDHLQSFCAGDQNYLELVSRASGAAGRLLSRDLDRTHVSSGTHSRAAE